MAASVPKISSDKERSAAEKGRNGLVHDAVAFDKAQGRLWKILGVHRASAGPRVRLFDLGHRQPVGVGGLLLFEGALEGVQEVPQTEGADGVAGDRVGGGREDRVDEPGGLAAVASLDNIAG